ncbi:nuclear receptor-binding protein-like [Argopecten irradians]|uniref:nuclear receptor-binding protein-like n=1 Tax=Argopecten irradians TaxID=31199 RepID=UPI00371B6B8D
MAEVDPENPAKSDSADESEDESEVLEESPCGRWQKRREEVEQRDVPSIDNAFLAMDTEEGVEVVWNEVQFSENRNLKAQEEKIGQVFDNLIQLDHPNIVKFHKYWTDNKDGKPRVIFITEYMSSGSLKQFLKKTKKNNKTFQLKAWKRWCTQILSALSYLHSCTPPVIHGNLTCDTIFIQHNGLIKIGSVAPDAMHHVKTYRKDIRNMHCVAPEYGENFGTAIDIYSFGMCALEIAALGIQGNGGDGGGNHISEESVKSTLESLDNSLQRDFISKCIQRDGGLRPSARELLFHAVLFEVHSLQLLAAHTFVNSLSILPENLSDEANIKKLEPNRVIAEIKHSDEREPLYYKLSQCPPLEMEKFLEDVRNGIYPLTAFTLKRPRPSRPRAKTPEVTESEKLEDTERMDIEQRLVMNMKCEMKKVDDSSNFMLTLILKMDDKINRKLQAEVTSEDNSQILAQELVQYGFINESDREKIADLIAPHFQSCMPLTNGTSPTNGILASA